MNQQLTSHKETESTGADNLISSTTSEVTTALHKVVASLRIAQEIAERHHNTFVKSSASELGKTADLADELIQIVMKAVNDGKD